MARVLRLNSVQGQERRFMGRSSREGGLPSELPAPRERPTGGKRHEARLVWLRACGRGRLAPPLPGPFAGPGAEVLRAGARSRVTPRAAGRAGPRTPSTGPDTPAVD